MAASRRRRCKAAGRRDMEAHPSEQELVESFLRPRVVSGDKSCTFIHEADVYTADPANLTRKFAPAVASNGAEAWYFFSAVRATKNGRKGRTVDDGEGCWHSEAGAKPVVGGSGRRLGHRQNFSFVTKDDAGQRVRSGWLMVELGLDDDGQDGEQLVLSKVYWSPRAPLAKKVVAATSSSSSSSSSCWQKRKLTTNASPPATRQRRRAARTSPGDDDDDEASSSPEALPEKEAPVADEPTVDAAQEQEDDVGGRGIISWWLRNRRYLMGEEYTKLFPVEPEVLPFHPSVAGMVDLLPPIKPLAFCSSDAEERDDSQHEPTMDLMEMPEIREFFRRGPQPPPPPTQLRSSIR